MKNVIKKAIETVICVALGLVVTGAIVWVVTLADNFKGF